jgi:hypothetical protein
MCGKLPFCEAFMKPFFTSLALVAAFFSGIPSSLSADIFQKPEEFISETFDGSPPAKKRLLITETIRKEIKDITGQEYKMLLVGYWNKGKKTVFILNDIGKTKPITTGFVVDGKQLQKVKVLIYRESHGWEVKYPFFTNQFEAIELTEENKLSKHIDGISGATLSVHALKRMTKLALYLQTIVLEKNEK